MIFKYLFPFDRFVIHSRLSSAEAVQALQTAVEPRKFMRFFGRGAKPFEGEIDGRQFNIRRIIGYNNGFLPTVVGTVEAAPDGSRVRIHMRLSVFTAVFCTGWIAFAALIGFSLLGSDPLAEIQRQPAVLGPFGMVAFAVLLINGAFWVEARMQKKMLIDIFKGWSE